MDSANSDENNFRCVRQETPMALRGAERRNTDEANRCKCTASMGSLSLNGKDSAATVTASSNVGSYKHGNGSCENGSGVQRTTFIAAFERCGHGNHDGTKDKDERRKTRVKLLRRTRDRFRRRRRYVVGK